MSRFPLVDCDTHGDGLQGFAVCVHILEAHRAIAICIPPTPDHLGEMLCESCALVKSPFDPDNLRLICARCAEHLIP